MYKIYELFNDRCYFFLDERFKSKDSSKIEFSFSMFLNCFLMLSVIVGFFELLFFNYFPDLFNIYVFIGNIVVFLLSSIFVEKKSRKLFPNKIEEALKLEDVFSAFFLKNNKELTYESYFCLDPKSLKKAIMSKEDLDLLLSEVVSIIGNKKTKKIMHDEEIGKLIREQGGISYYCFYLILNKVEYVVEKNNISKIVDSVSHFKK